MAVKIFSIILVLIAGLIGAFGAVMLKKGSAHLHRNFKGIFFNWHLIFGAALYGVSTVLFIFALKDSDLSVMYPFVAVTYVWISLFSIKFFGEKMNKWKWLGIAAILVGVSLIGLGS